MIIEIYHLEKNGFLLIVHGIGYMYECPFISFVREKKTALIYRKGFLGVLNAH